MFLPRPVKPRSGMVDGWRLPATGGSQFPCVGKKHAVSIWGIGSWPVIGSARARRATILLALGRLLDRLGADLILVPPLIGLATDCIDRGKGAEEMN